MPASVALLGQCDIDNYLTFVVVTEVTDTDCGIAER